MPFKAFVSSTFLDLKDYRGHIIETLRKSGFFVDPMEDWTAASDEPKQFSQDRVKGCDLCILLVGFRRGHVPKDQDFSITQLEYKAALELGIDILVFMLKEQAPWPHEFDELDKDPEIRQWRKELTEGWGVGFFGHDPKSIEISPALTRWLIDKGLQQKETTFKPPSSPIVSINRNNLRYGLSLGWQLARYEFIYGSEHPEALAARPSVERDIANLLSQDNFPHSTKGLDYRMLVNAVLNYYGIKAIDKHAAILLGVAAMYISLVGTSKNEQHNIEMADLALDVIQNIDSTVLHEKQDFFQALLKKHPNTLNDVLDFIESLR